MGTTSQEATLSGTPREFAIRKNYRCLATGTSVPTSWTTVYPAPRNVRAVINWLTAVSTSSGTYTVQIALLRPDATRIELGQGRVVEDGEQIRFFESGTCVVVEPGWALQMLGTASNACHYSIMGEEVWVQ